MKRAIYNSKIYFDSYDNEAFAPQEFESYKTQPKVKMSDIIKRVKFDFAKGDESVQSL
jgi:hypothetical protein